MANKKNITKKARKATQRLRVSPHHVVAIMLSLVSIASAIVTNEFKSDAANVPVSAKHAVTSRVSERLSGRFHAAGLDIDVDAAQRIMQARTEFLMRDVGVQFQTDDAATSTGIVLRVSEHPEWLSYSDRADAPVSIDASAVRLSLLHVASALISPAVDCAVQTVTPDRDGVLRATTDCRPKDGMSFDVDAATANIAKALASQQHSNVTVPLTRRKGTLTNASDFSFGDLELLGTGRSNFKGSPLGRKNNIKKAINEQINGVIVPADATFSFNSLLGGPVTLSRGWSMALGIFDGGDLRPTPGGGICQTSTTTYRALLLAGLPIKVQRNHSLYVHYYEEYGVGLDATVFYGHQDLTFVNDTGHPLLLMSWIDGDDAFVSIYGSSDGRTVEMQGPYFWTNAPADLQINGREIRRNEIAWIRVIKLPNGAEARELRVSQYKQLPKNLARQYEPTKVASE